jgi:Fe-S cluster assembly protein SufB
VAIRYLGSVVPYNAINPFARPELGGSPTRAFCYIPWAGALPGWSCPPTSRINAADTGQFERTLIIAEEGAYVRHSRGLHRAGEGQEPAARRSWSIRRAPDDAQTKYSTVQNW